MPTNNDLKPWSTTDIPIFSHTLDNYYDWSSIVQAMVDFHDAAHLTTNPAPLEQRLAKQLVFFLSRTVASTHRPALLGQTPAAAWSLLQDLNPQTGHSLEDLVQRGYDISLIDLGPKSYATQHRLTESNCPTPGHTPLCLPPGLHQPCPEGHGGPSQCASRAHYVPPYRAAHTG
jgi:hypothetical protein